jgi:pimeloyl-ACP methyl ester carboxylesterase
LEIEEAVDTPGEIPQMAIMQTDIILNIGGASVFARQFSAEPSSARVADFPIVLLHDSLGSVELWREFPDLLARRTGRSVIAYDRLGFGRSSPRRELPAANFIHQEAEEVLPALLAELGINEFAIFGHSVGAAMALLAAARFGDRCRGVVSEAGQAFNEDRTTEGIRRAQENFRDPEQFARLERWHGEKARWVLDAWTGSWLSPEFAQWSLAPDLPRVKSPVLVIHGDRDEYGSIRMPETIARHVGGPVEVHVLSDCGHVPHRERPEEVAGLVANFLQKSP